MKGSQQASDVHLYMGATDFYFCVSRFQLLLFHAATGRWVNSNNFSFLQSCKVNLWTVEVLPSINDPLNRSDDNNNRKSHDTVIHIRTRDWEIRRENEKYRRYNDIYDSNLLSVSFIFGSKR